MAKSSGAPTKAALLVGGGAAVGALVGAGTAPQGGDTTSRAMVGSLVGAGLAVGAAYLGGKDKVGEYAALEAGALLAIVALINVARASNATPPANPQLPQ